MIDAHVAVIKHEYFLLGTQDMTEALRESLIHMVHTKEGARVAMACVWGGSAKVGWSQRGAFVFSGLRRPSVCVCLRGIRDERARS